jgi:hypothetical protein
MGHPADVGGETRFRHRLQREGQAASLASGLTNMKD